MVKDYFLQNWGLLLVLIAFAITLHTTIVLEKKIIRRLYVMIVEIFLLSIVVYIEFLLADSGEQKDVRVVLMAIRYSATPFIISQVVYSHVLRQHWMIFFPAIGLAVIDCISIFNGVIFSIGDDNSLRRGALGFLPYITVGLYSVFLIVMLFRRSNKQSMEIIPIVFLGFALGTGLFMPFVFGSNYSQIFCTTIAIAVYAYYVFSIQQLAKKDSLTGLLNRKAYYADVCRNPEDVTAIISIDMNGLKVINDTQGHAAGDEALVTLALCFIRSLRLRQSCYRVGGDEFLIICRKNSEEDVIHLVNRIRNHVAETGYSCSIGYCFRKNASGSVDDLLMKSDEMMYAEKAQHYQITGMSRR